ncbi:hypothetical protein MSPP1_000980 [Malassezia sp. CBS 17886]|nr:hypothetical protein MSPP1_000980 [Malassezia sp. CBS 17886]
MPPFAAVLGLVTIASWLYAALWTGVPVTRTGYAQGDAPAYMRVPSQGYFPRYNTSGTEGAVACESDICSAVGAHLLELGGSASDAATGAALCVGVVNAFHSGIGGGGFALVKTAGSEPVMVDYRETAPGAAYKDMYRDAAPNASYIGGLAAGVPGELRGYEALHGLYGRLPWQALFEPAVTIARHGFLVPWQLRQKMMGYEELLCGDAYFRSVYCPGGRLRRESELVRLPALAATLAELAECGADAFYKGPMAQRTVDAAAAHGGVLSLADLERYTVLFRNAASIVFGGRYRVWSTIAPSSGSVVLSALKTMDYFPWEPYRDTAVLEMHRLIEATKFAFGERTHYGDPAFVRNITRLEALAITDAAAEKRRGLISDRHVFPPEYYDPEKRDVMTDGGTSHLSAVDADGMAVSMTTTVNLLWGARFATGDGILLNDDMDDFSSPNASNQFGYVPSPANFIRAGKRPLSSMSPFIIEDIPSGDIVHIGGSAGGSRIITTNIINAYAFMTHAGNTSLQEIISWPRWHDQVLPPFTAYEYPTLSLPHFPGQDNDESRAYVSTCRALKRRGHWPVWIAPETSSAQGIARVPGGPWQSATEVRQRDSRGAALSRRDGK